jgi:heme/copper-type cytochrome/quinol oxidase subunit 2
MKPTTSTQIHSVGARWLAFVALALAAFCPMLRGQALSQPRVIEILADHDSRYKMDGLKQPMITVKAGEEVTLRITAKKAQGHNRDGSIHGFSLLRAKDRKPVDGWDLLLKPGTQEFHLTAPSEAGEYVVICTVICSQDHEGMSMKFLVEP